MSKYNIILLLICCVVILGKAQLSIDTSRSAEYIVKTVLVGKSGNLQIENIQYKGDKKSLGIFDCPIKYNKMISRGIILSTGNAFDAIGPNNSPNVSSKSLINEDKDLSELANGKTFDAAILEFDFIPSHDSICFSFFFASEEYPEYINKNVNDVFGFFLSSDALNTERNLAVFENNIPISVDNINAKINSKYYIANSIWDSDNIQKWRNKKAEGELAFTFQYDGFTILLNAGTKVIPNQRYHIKLAISDVGDRLYDSAIFLEAGSFKSFSIQNHFEQFVKEEFGERDIINVNKNISVNLNINFETDSFRISGAESFALLDKIVLLSTKDTTMRIEINGHTDDTGKREYNKTLSLNRAKEVAGYLMSKGLKSNRINYEGYGDTRPISLTDKSLNRRVECIFIKSFH